MADLGVFSKLRRLFSTGTIIRNVGKGQLRVADTDNVQAYINRRGIDRFNRVYGTQSGGYGSVHGRSEQSAAFQGARLQLFRDYDMMDNDSIIASVLDIYADESTIKDEYGKVLGIKSNNNTVKEILDNLFYDILNIDFNLWPWVRNMCKYGDFFLFLELHETFGVTNVIPLSVYETMRIEGEEETNPFSVKFKLLNDFLSLGKTDLDNFEVAHFRLLSDTNFLPYGKAMVENGRRVWKQLQLMEDAMLVHRIMRAPDKRKFLIDVGNLPPNEIDAYINKLADTMKKDPLIDPRTGDYNIRYNMMNITEDFYLPVRGKEAATDIQTMSGLTFNAIEDIEYLRKKLMAAFKVPKSFLGYEEDLSGKATLASQDVRFARTIERIQRIVLSELRKIAIVHLYIQGYRDAELINFDLSMSSPSMIYEQEKLSLWAEKVQLASTIVDSHLLSQKWVYNNIFELSEDEMEEQRTNIEGDIRRMAELTRIEMQISQPPEKTPPDSSFEEPLVGTPEDSSSEEDTNSDEESEPKEEMEEATDEEETDDSPLAQAMRELRQLNGDLSEEEDESEDVEEAKTGRPRKNIRYRSDNHPFGRDPLGQRSAFTDRAKERENSSIRALTKELSEVYGESGSLKRMITEDGEN